MAHDTYMRTHCLQPVYALFLGMHHSAWVRGSDGSSTRAWLGVVLGEAEDERGTFERRRHAVERGGDHHEGERDEV